MPHVVSHDVANAIPGTVAARHIGVDTHRPRHAARAECTHVGTGHRLPALRGPLVAQTAAPERSEEHTSELQSQFHLVCRLLLEKKKKKQLKQDLRQKKKTKENKK